MQVKIFGLACLMLLSTVVFGQKSMTDKTHDLDEVVVKSTKLQDYAVGSNVQKVDSLEKARFSNYSLADLLKTVSLVNINSNGPGGLSNPAIRGGSSAQTAIIWNGVNIRSFMDGSVDLAQLPSPFFSNIDIQYGGSGTLFGSGAAAGAIHLGGENLFASKNHIGLKLSYGSFENRNAYFTVKTGDSELSNSFKYFYNQARNDYDYEIADDVKVEQTNAALEQHAFLNETQLKTSSNSNLRATVWYQKYHKDVQTLISATEPNQAFQEDDNLRLALNWTLAKNNFILKVKSVYLANKIHYVNPVGDWASDDTHKPKTLINEVEAKIRFNENHSLITGLNFTYEESESTSYSSLFTRRRLSAFASYKMENILDRITWVNSARQELVEDELTPFIFSSGLRVDVLENIVLNSSLSRIYRLPTTNDLFWPGSGNPDLKSEKGWSLDAGLEENFKTGNTNFTFKQNFFLNDIKDYIAWAPLPTEADPYRWIPENKDKVKTIGVDLAACFDVKLSDKTLLKLNGTYTWIQSDYVTVDGDNEIKTRRTYVPKHRFLLNLGVYQKNWNIVYTHNYFDFRLTNSYDAVTYEQLLLGPYFTGDISAEYTFPLGNQSLTASLQVNNIWNRNYEVIYDYAMPRRNFKFSLYYNLNL